MSPASSRWFRSLTPLALSAATCVGGACVSASYSARRRVPDPEPEPPQLAEPRQLLSAHLAAFGLETEAEISGSRPAEGSEASQDRLVLVFADPLDPLTLSPFAFAILRADGNRVRPTRAFLAPADERDENRSVTLIGNFAADGVSPVAIHVIGPLFAESGAELEGLDADITPFTEPDRPVLIERLPPNPSRCPEAAQLIRATWTDTLTQVGAGDLAAIDLRLADGRVIHPIEFDDQAIREGEPPGLGPSDDNVLDLCLDTSEVVVFLHFAAGLFSDPAGHRSAAADVALPAP